MKILSVRFYRYWRSLTAPRVAYWEIDMPRFRSTNRSGIVNRAGGEAYAQSPKMALANLLLTSFVKNTYYESAEERLERLAELVGEVKDKLFVAKAAIFARREYGMRSITHALAAELVNVVKGEEWTKRAVTKVCARPDDMLEILGYWLNVYGKPVPNS